MDGDREDYAKLMDDLERQDRLLLMVTDRLVDTIEELKLAYAAKDSNSLAESTSTSTVSITSTASTPQTTSTPCGACTARVEGTVNSGNDDTNVDKQTLSVTKNVTPVSQHLDMENKPQNTVTRGQTTGNLGSKTQTYLETDIDAVPCLRKTVQQNCHQQEWTVTLTDGTGKSRVARSVNQRIEK
ncbi:uncharacterized protein [Amphiura filiformis]|uniref:uncharacterized protein n=1 Tax=Amphiura filiformis TaxID=82378 RepID=UPI003B228CE2